MQPITIAHSPDSDDIFMFYGLRCGAIPTPGHTLSYVADEIQVLNERALAGTYDVTALSLAAYPAIARDYAILDCGASMAEKDYGPVVVAKDPLELRDLKRVAVPGLHTTAALVLRLIAPHLELIPLSFNDVLPAVIRGDVQAGLLIHEAQVLYRQSGCHAVLKLGEWWQAKTRLPLPLGINVIRKSLGASLCKTIQTWIHDSIQYALAHRADAIAYTREAGLGHDISLVDRYIDMYVNERTVHYGEVERRAVDALFSAAHQAGLLQPITVEWI